MHRDLSAPPLSVTDSANRQSTHQSNNPSIHQPINQSINQSVNQSINQSINHHFSDTTVTEHGKSNKLTSDKSWDKTLARLTSKKQTSDLSVWQCLNDSLRWSDFINAMQTKPPIQIRDTLKVFWSLFQQLHRNRVAHARVPVTADYSRQFVTSDYIKSLGHRSCVNECHVHWLVNWLMADWWNSVMDWLNIKFRFIESYIIVS